MKNAIDTLLRDWTFNSTFEFFEGKSDELTAVAEKRGIVLPAHDLSPFKCVYAFTDRMNKNGCILPKEEVDKSLKTLVGKAIDFDHLRKRVVGHWIDAKIDGDKIIAYGIFYKGNFNEDYAMIKNMLEKDVLAISFEAWGNRNPQKDSAGYTLSDIEFAGGALLIKTDPAFPGSQVMEMANRNRVLEFASIMKKPEEFMHFGEVNRNKKPEFARMYLSDIETIYRVLSEVDCPVCDTKGQMDVTEMNYEDSEAEMTCVNCGTKLKVKLTPCAEMASSGIAVKSVQTAAEIAMFDNIVSYIKGFTDSDEALELKVASELEGEIENAKITNEERKALTDDKFAITVSQDSKKIRIFPIHDQNHVRGALKSLDSAKVQQTLQKLGVSIDSVKRDIMNKAKELNMEELLKKYNKSSIDEVLQEIAKAALQRDVTPEEVASLKTKVEGMEKVSDEAVQEIVKEFATVKLNEAKEAELAKLKADLEAAQKVSQESTEKTKAMEAEIAKLVAEVDTFKKAKEEAEKAAVAEKVKARRDELGEFAKDMSDEAILSDKDYELAKLRKENEDLKSGKAAQPKKPMAKGSADKTAAEVSSRQKVDKYCSWGK